MGIMARDCVLCAVVLVQLLSVGQCYRGVRSILRDLNLELPTPAHLSNAADSVFRSCRVLKDSLIANSASERFLEAVQHSHRRMSLRQRKLRITADFGAEAVEVPVSFGSAVFVMPVSLGTPPQQFTVEVDTGSQLCWVQCAPCKRCFKQPHALFNPMASTSYSEAACDDPLCQEALYPTCRTANSCNYFYNYEDASSARGVLAYETLTMPGSSVAHFGFGCGRDNGGNFESEDGLFGLAQGPLSLPSQLGMTKVFSYCLVAQFSAGTRSSSLTFGDAAENSNETYTPMVPNPYGDYYLGVTGITVGGQALTIPASAFEFDSDGNGGVILDSGTTLTYWIQAAFDPIIAAFRQQIAFSEVDADAYNLNLCYDISGVAASIFADMVVHMANGVNLEIPAVSLFIPVTDTNVMCLCMVPADDASTIGNILQENNLVVYDIVNQRIGFQKMQC